MSGDARTHPAATDADLSFAPANGRGAPGAVPPPPTLSFIGAAELRARTPQEPTWLWQHYIAKASITMLAGKPKSGKSTLALALAEALVLGGAAQFLGCAITPAPVVYVSEEGAATLRHKLPHDDRLRIVTREGAWPKPTWANIVIQAIEEARRVAAGLIVIDTFAYWSQLPAEKEQDAGATSEAINRLVAATTWGISGLLVHHQRKGGGEDGEGVRGSTAIPGAVDVVMELERPAGNDVPPTHRQLVTLGRWPDIPPVLVVDRDQATASWRVISEADSRHDAGPRMWATRLEEAIERNPGITITELEETLGSVRKEWNEALRMLLASGQIERLGLGRRGAPFRHYPASSDSVDMYESNMPNDSVGGLRGDSVEIPWESRPRSPTETQPDSVGDSVGVRSTPESPGNGPAPVEKTDPRNG